MMVHTKSSIWLPNQSVVIYFLTTLSFFGCSTSTRNHIVQETSIAYLNAFERINEEPSPNLAVPALQWGLQENDWILEANEVPLDTIIRTLDPSIMIGEIPPSWVGRVVSIRVKATDAENCIDQIFQAENASWNFSKNKRFIQENQSPPSPSTERLDRSIILNHISVETVQEGISQFLLTNPLQTNIAFSTESNQIFLIGPEDQVNHLTSMIEHLDRPPPVCCVQTWISSVRDVDEFFFTPQPLLTQNGWTLNLAAPPELQDIFQFNTGSLSVSLWSASKNPGEEFLKFNAAMARARKSSLAAPLLLCLSGNQSEIYLGRVGWRLFTTPTSPTSSEIQTQNITTGTTLKISPTVLSEDRIKIDIDLTTSVFSTDTALTANQTVRTASTSVQIHKGDVLKIAGVHIPRFSRATQGLAPFRNFPILKWFTSSENSTAQDDNFDLYLTADIVDLQGRVDLIPSEFQTIVNVNDQQILEAL